MTTEQYEAWKLAPEQVEKLQELEAKAQALREAEEQARLTEAEATKEAVIQSFMADGLPRSVAEHYYNALPKS
jgi:predicted solute-binding protein